MKTRARKPRNRRAQDATLINISALKRRLTMQGAQLEQLQTRVRRLEQRTKP